MELKITGIVKELLTEQTGTSAKGDWRKREFILTTEGEYPKQICMVRGLRLRSTSRVASTTIGGTRT